MRNKPASINPTSIFAHSDIHTRMPYTQVWVQKVKNPFSIEDDFSYFSRDLIITISMEFLSFPFNSSFLIKLIKKLFFSHLELSLGDYREKYVMWKMKKVFEKFSIVFIVWRTLLNNSSCLLKEQSSNSELLSHFKCYYSRKSRKIRWWALMAF